MDRAQLGRRQLLPLADSPAQSVYVISPEDTILAKLDWYTLGQEVSERQWRDGLGVLKAQETNLDWGYLHAMAREMGITDLLARAHQATL